MRYFYDTTVLMAALLPNHVNFRSAQAAFQDTCNDPAIERFISQHSIAELYCNFTRYPCTPRISPNDALLLVSKGVLPFVTPIGVTPKDYNSLISNLAMQGITGAAVYDGLIAYCAELSSADRLFTFTRKDFLRAWPAGAGKIVEP
jgi:predicted nucleic acid-binding protein